MKTWAIQPAVEATAKGDLNRNHRGERKKCYASAAFIYADSQTQS
jgi:hypothetical protein